MNAQTALDLLAGNSDDLAFICATLALPPEQRAAIERIRQREKALDQWATAIAVEEAPPCRSA